MGWSGLEPPTSRLSGVCSNLLSYQPILRQNPPFCSFLPFDKPSLFGRLLLFSIKVKLLWKPPEFLYPGGSLLRNNLLFPYTSALLDPLSTYLRYALLLSFLWVLPSLALWYHICCLFSCLSLINILPLSTKKWWLKSRHWKSLFTASQLYRP